MPHSNTPIQKRLCVGVDLHKVQMTIATLDPTTGESTFTVIACKSRHQVREFFGSLARPHVVAIEAVGFYRWLWDELEPIVEELVLADATQCRALAGRRIKTDRQDALNVAELLAAGRLPIAWAPPVEVAALRDVTRHRHYLSKQHARCLHRVKMIMCQVNRPGPARMRAPQLMRYVEAQRSKLPAHLVVQLEMAIDELVLLERQLDRIAESLKGMLAEPRWALDADRLMSFPGVGVLIAAAILAEVGDFDRFADRDALTRYAGLNPRTFASDATVRTGSIAKAGSRELRWALVQAAWTAVRCDDSVKRIWLRVRKRAGGKGAIIAIARRMLLWMRAAHRQGVAYRQAA